jgi:transcriptional regulator of acetoin/glycerol metabolism
LQNIIEYAMVLCRSDVIDLNCLPPDLRTGPDSTADPPPTDPLAAAEAETIRRALREHAGHRGHTAQALGIDKSTLWRKMKRFGIEFPCRGTTGS